MARTMTANRHLQASGIGPSHAILLAFPMAFYPAALVSDIAYLNTAVIQWSNFSSWLLVGANVFAGFVLAWAIIAAIWGGRRWSRGRRWLYPMIVAAMFAVGVLNSFQHSRDGWHSVGTFGLVLSMICTLLALAATTFAHRRAPAMGKTA